MLFLSLRCTPSAIFWHCMIIEKFHKSCSLDILYFTCLNFKRCSDLGCSRLLFCLESSVFSISNFIVQLLIGPFVTAIKMYVVFWAFMNLQGSLVPTYSCGSFPFFSQFPSVWFSLINESCVTDKC